MASRREYITIAEALALAGVTATDLEISAAEELIDGYVGFQDKFISNQIQGEVSAGSTTSKLIDDAGGSSLGYQDDYFSGCLVRILSGSQKGATSKVASSSRSEKSITLSTNLSGVPTEGSLFVIEQFGKFPRACDVTTNRAGTAYFKAIPQKVKEAVAYQVQFMQEMGAEFFDSDKGEYNSETIGNYSYSKGGGNGSASSYASLIAPKAKAALRGIKNLTGRLSIGDR